MVAKVEDYMTESQWASVQALKEIEPFKGLPEDMENSVESWADWNDLPAPELEELPGDWPKKCNDIHKIMLLRAMRPDRVTTALRSFIGKRLGDRYVNQDPFNMEDTYLDSSTPTPLFFVLFPGVDPGTDIEKLGQKLGFTIENGRYVSISMGQGQEANAENVLDKFTLEGGWVFLQNIHLMQTWLPILERKLEIVTEKGHEDFRAFLSAEPPPLPHMQTIPEGIMQSAIKVANEPASDVKTNVKSSYALYSQQDLDCSTKPKYHRPMLLGLCFYHALVLARRKFGKTGFSRAYAFNNGDLTVCGQILHNYLEKNETTPWEDINYLFGEVMYGGHITDDWDRRITSTYLDVILRPGLVEEPEYEYCPGWKPLLTGEYVDYVNFVEKKFPPESPIILGLHPNAEIGLLISDNEYLFGQIQAVEGAGGGGGGGGKEEKVQNTLTFILDNLPEEFSMIEVKGRNKERTPYIVFVLQETERANGILNLIKRDLVELELGLSGALNISDSMDALITAIFANVVPNTWLKLCNQVGPTGVYNRKNLGDWYTDLLKRVKQLASWTAVDLSVPISVWVSGLFNSMGFVTAVNQTTARAKQLPLDDMMSVTDVLEIEDETTIDTKPEEGAYIHGMFMEGARWDIKAGVIADSKPKDLYPQMPVVWVKATTVENVPKENIYVCPVFTTTIRGPTFAFRSYLKVDCPISKWVLASVCLVMQPD